MIIYMACTLGLMYHKEIDTSHIFEKGIIKGEGEILSHVILT